MSHFLLPYGASLLGHGPGPRDPGALRFGNFAMTGLIQKLTAFGSRKPDLVAQVFGGANLPNSKNTGEQSVGVRNVHVALDILETEGIEILQVEVGGERGRKVLFLTDDGRAWVKPALDGMPNSGT